MKKDTENRALLESKLQREKKADLLKLLQELEKSSPEARRFLQARYLPKFDGMSQTAAYRQAIEAQFIASDWSNTFTLSWDFETVQKVLTEFSIASQDNAKGLAELLVVALEVSVGFVNVTNLHDIEFELGLSELVDRCEQHFSAHPGQIRDTCNFGPHPERIFLRQALFLAFCFLWMWPLSTRIPNLPLSR